MCFPWFDPLTGLQNVRARFWRCYAIQPCTHGTQLPTDHPLRHHLPPSPPRSTPIRLYPHGYRGVFDWLSPPLVGVGRWGLRTPPRGFKIWFQIIPWNGPVDLSRRSLRNYARLDSFGRGQINSAAPRCSALFSLSLYVSFFWSSHE